MSRYIDADNITEILKRSVKYDGNRITQMLGVGNPRADVL